MAEKLNTEEQILKVAREVFMLNGYAGTSMQMIADEAGISEEMIEVDISDEFKNSQRPAAIFRHDEHNESAEIEECNECHHVYDDSGELIEDESSEDQRCSECHEVEASDERPALMKAFHRNCKGCHEEQKDGPVMCGQCHVRRVDFEE